LGCTDAHIELELDRLAGLFDATPRAAYDKLDYDCGGTRQARKYGKRRCVRVAYNACPAGRANGARCWGDHDERMWIGGVAPGPGEAKHERRPRQDGERQPGNLGHRTEQTDGGRQDAKHDAGRIDGREGFTLA
jgi:hypothetical protein